MYKCRERDKTQRRDATSTVSRLYTKRMDLGAKLLMQWIPPTLSCKVCPSWADLFPFRQTTAGKSLEVWNLGSIDHPITLYGYEDDRPFWIDIFISSYNLWMNTFMQACKIIPAGSRKGVIYGCQEKRCPPFHGTPESHSGRNHKQWDESADRKGNSKRSHYCCQRDQKPSNPDSQNHDAPNAMRCIQDVQAQEDMRQILQGVCRIHL